MYLVHLVLPKAHYGRKIWNTTVSPNVNPFCYWRVSTRSLSFLFVLNDRIRWLLGCPIQKPCMIYWGPRRRLCSFFESESESCSVVSLCDPLDYTVHGILQARILEWVAFPFSRGSSQPRDQTQVSCIAGGFFTSWVTRVLEATEFEYSYVGLDRRWRRKMVRTLLRESESYLKESWLVFDRQRGRER